MMWFRKISVHHILLYLKTIWDVNIQMQLYKTFGLCMLCYWVRAQSRWKTPLILLNDSKGLWHFDVTPVNHYFCTQLYRTTQIKISLFKTQHDCLNFPFWKPNSNFRWKSIVVEFLSLEWKLDLHCKCFDHKNYEFWPCPKSGHNVTIVSMTFWKKKLKKNSKKWGQKIFFFRSKKIFFVGHDSLKLWLKSTVLHWLSF